MTNIMDSVYNREQNPDRQKPHEIHVSKINLRYFHENRFLCNGGIVGGRQGQYLAQSYSLSGRSVWGNLDPGREHRPNVVRSVHMTKVKIPAYWHTDRLN